MCLRIAEAKTICWERDENIASDGMIFRISNTPGRFSYGKMFLAFLFRHQTKAESNVSRSEIEEWAKRPLPGEEIYMVGEAFSLIDSWNEGSLRSAYIALKEGWGIASPEP